LVIEFYPGDWLAPPRVFTTGSSEPVFLTFVLQEYILCYVSASCNQIRQQL